MALLPWGICAPFTTPIPTPQAQGCQHNQSTPHKAARSASPPPPPVDEHEVAGDALCLQLLARLDGSPGGGHAQQHAVLVHPSLFVQVDQLPAAGHKLVCARADGQAGGTAGSDCEANGVSEHCA